MENLYLFVLVNFIRSRKDYWYLCDDISISVGDYVSVSVNDSLEICVIKDKIVATKENAPYDFDKIKKIISKVDKNTASEQIVFGQTTAANNSNQVYFYHSKKFGASDLPIPIFDKFFKYSDNGITEFNTDEKYDFYPVPKTVLLKDGLTEASLFSIYSVKDKNDSRFDVDAAIGMNTQKIFIPYCYKSVDFSGCNIEQIILSDGVENIDGDGSIRCKVINIPQSLNIINSILRKGHNVTHGPFNKVCWEKIILDPNNQYFKFINGILYYVFENKRYILWVDNSVESIIIDDKIFGILPLDKDVDLIIKDEGFYKKQEEFSCGKDIAQLLNTFRSVTIKRFNSEYNVLSSSIKRLILEDETIVKNIRCKKKFPKKYAWFLNGCQTKKDFEEFIEFNISSLEYFIDFIPNSESPIHSLVDFDKSSYYQRDVEEIKEFDNGAITFAKKPLSNEYTDITSSIIDSSHLNKIRNCVVSSISKYNKLSFKNRDDLDKFLFFVLHNYNGEVNKIQTMTAGQKAKDAGLPFWFYDAYNGDCHWLHDPDVNKDDYVLEIENTNEYFKAPLNKMFMILNVNDNQINIQVDILAKNDY